MNINKYIREVIKPLLPKAQVEWYVDNYYQLFGMNQLKDSIYERQFLEDTCFLHFTSVSNFLEIIRSKTIRLSDFNSFKDKFELTYANNNLVSNSYDFTQLKSSLFALSLCEDNKENLTNDYMWFQYGKNHKGVCLRLKINKEKSRFFNFHLGKINYCNNNTIDELHELKQRHENFLAKNNWSISNFESFLLSACSMYKKSVPFSKENEIRLLCYVWKNINSVHTNTSMPIRHKYDEEKNQILYFLELELEYKNDKNDKYRLPHISVDSVTIGNDLCGDTFGKLKQIIDKEFFDSFNRKLDWHQI